MNLNDIDIKTYEEKVGFQMYVDYINFFGDIFEFGIYGGCSLRNLIEQLIDKQVDYHNIFAFDSFRGLPINCKNSGIPFFKGDYNTQRLLGTTDIEAIKQYILKRTFFIPILIEGFFEEVLTKDLILKHNIQPASYIHMDCDLYSSACTVLDWVFSNNLFKVGTIIRYDDWFSKSISGEEKAHKEMCEKYNIGTEIVYRDMIELVVVKII